jgi:hypothetical protein
MPVIPLYFQQEMPAVSRPEEAPSAETLPIIRKHKFENPKLRLHLNDISHEGSSIFLSNTKGNEDLEMQVQNVLNLLYTPSCHRPGTRSVTIVLRPMDGVAYTTGTDLDHDHKEIHFNLNYIKKSHASPRDEILGVICHELVHCFQWAAHGTCPGGLIEGVADWVRLRAGLAAAHWKQSAEGKWDGGYQHTGYFLDYLEQRFGQGTVRKMNGCLRAEKYDEGKLFGECCGGKKVEELWMDYGEELKKKGKGDVEEGAAPEPVPTHGALQA